MQESRDLERRPRQAEPRQRRSGRAVAAVPAANWRLLVLALLPLVALAAVVLLHRSISGAVDARRPPAGAVDAPLQPLTALKQLEAARSADAQASARPTAVPTPPTLRPPTSPTMPPVRSAGLAPVRKPGTPDPDPSTQHVVVVDGESGAILFQRNAFEPIAPASLTKIMTAILGIEYGNLSDRVHTDVSASSLPDSTLMGLEPWFDVTLEDLLYGLMLPSGNDAALAIGRYVSGSDEAFVRLMNWKARWLGLECTNFTNPHGLDEPDHYSCPYDMVTMARYGMQYRAFRQLAAATRYDIRRSNISYTIYNLNPILGAYPGADGVKVGYTDEAGRSIVATAVKNGHRVYVAFMRSTAGLVPDTMELLDWAFDSFTWPDDSGTDE